MRDQPCDAAGVVISVDAYGKHTVSRVYIKDGVSTLVPVTDGRSLGAAGRVAALEMDVLAGADLPRGKVKLKAPAPAAIKVNQ